MFGFRLSKMHKIILGAIVLVSVAVVGFFAWIGSRAESYVRAELAQQELVAGTLDIGTIGASLNGAAWITDITWHDPAGNLVAQIPRLNISVRFSDLLSGGISNSSIQSVILERPELYLTYSEKEGLNITNLLMVEPKEAKTKRPEEQPRLAEDFFLGVFKINDGLLQLKTPRGELVFDDFNFTLDYASYPTATGTLNAKQNEAVFAGDIEVNYTEAGEKIRVRLDADYFSLEDIFKAVEFEQELKFVDGSLSKFKIYLLLDEKENLEFEASGEVVNLALETEGLNIAEVNGRFSSTLSEVTLTNLAGLLNEQPVQIDGTINIAAQPYQLDLLVQSPSFKATALSKGLSVDDPLTFTAKVRGTTQEPKVSGSFAAAALQTEQFNMANAKGSFNYAEGVVNLTDFQAGVYGGSLTAQGQIKTEDETFALNFSGSGINSSVLVSNNLSGPLSFTAYAIGDSDLDSLAVSGNFAIGRGNFNNIPFNSLTGNFTKSGSKMSFSQVVINTLAGSLSINATIQTDGKVKLDNIDASDLSSKKLEASAKEIAAGEVEKGKEKLANALRKAF